jgi:hypothetical protein
MGGTERFWPSAPPSFPPAELPRLAPDCSEADAHPAKNTSFRGHAAFAANDAVAAAKSRYSVPLRQSGGHRQGMAFRRGRPANAAATHRSSCVRRGSVPDPRKTTHPYPGESFSPPGLSPLLRSSIFRAPRTSSSAPMGRDSTTVPNSRNSTSVLLARFGARAQPSTVFRFCCQSSSGHVRAHVKCLRSGQTREICRHHRRASRPAAGRPRPGKRQLRDERRKSVQTEVSDNTRRLTATPQAAC